MSEQQTGIRGGIVPHEMCDLCADQFAEANDDSCTFPSKKQLDVSMGNGLVPVSLPVFLVSLCFMIWGGVAGFFLPLGLGCFCTEELTLVALVAFCSVPVTTCLGLAIGLALGGELGSRLFTDCSR